MVKVPVSVRLKARIPVDVRSLLKRAAELQGQSLIDFVVTAPRDAAHRVIEEAETIRLSVEDQRQLADAVLKPRAPAPALRRAFAQRCQFLPASTESRLEVSIVELEPKRR